MSIKSISNVLKSDHPLGKLGVMIFKIDQRDVIIISHINQLEKLAVKNQKLLLRARIFNTIQSGHVYLRYFTFN